MVKEIGNTHLYAVYCMPNSLSLERPSYLDIGFDAAAADDDLGIKQSFSWDSRENSAV